MTGRNEAGDERSMGEILASIRRIVSDEERARRDRGAGPDNEVKPDGVLVLTPAMRAGAAASPLENAGDGEGALDLGRAARLVSPPRAPTFTAASGLTVSDVEEIVRRVLREELKGPVGLEISRKVKASIREEVRRVLDEEDPLI